MLSRCVVPSEPYTYYCKELYTSRTTATVQVHDKETTCFVTSPPYLLQYPLSRFPHYTLQAQFRLPSLLTSSGHLNSHHSWRFLDDCFRHLDTGPLALE